MNEQVRMPPMVLIVEDDPTTTHILRRLLAGAGYRTNCANSQAGTWAVLQQQIPDLVLLDVNLPDGNGFEICQRLQRESGCAGIPVLFISANEDVASKVRGFEVGGVDYISKPLAGAEVLARVGTHLRLRRAYEALVELQAERLKGLATAQQNMMPAPEDFPEAKFCAAIRQRQLAGGDFYDVVRSGEASSDYLVADASGHDLGTSYWTAALKALVAEYASPINAPAGILSALNSALGRILPSGAFFTVAYARLNRGSRRLSLASAGHPPAIITRARANEATVLWQEGDVVGAFPDPIFGVKELSLCPGDRLFLYSDGLVENGGPVSAGVARLAAACQAGVGQPLAELIPSILNAIAADHEGADDMVLLGVDG